MQVLLPKQGLEDVPHKADEVGGVNHIESLQVLLVPAKQEVR